MGLDYIRSAAGKPYIKRWAKGLNRLKTPTLLDTNLSPESRIVTAMLVPGCTPKPSFLLSNTAKPLERLDSPPDCRPRRSHVILNI